MDSVTIKKQSELIEIRNVDYSEAKREVLDYYRTYKEAFPHEVAEALELDYELVWMVTEDLKIEKKLRFIG